MVSDDTLLVEQIVGDAGRLIVVICEGRPVIRPRGACKHVFQSDFVGGTCRETVEQRTSAPCLFLLGRFGRPRPAPKVLSGDVKIADPQRPRAGIPAPECP